MKHWRRGLQVIALLALGGPAAVGVSGAVSLGGDWRSASRDSAGLAPPPESTPEAVVQVYAARAFNWRGLFAVHTWIALKPAGAPAYTVHQVLGWRGRDGGRVVDSRFDVPDRYWYGAAPEVLADIRGERAGALIGAIEAAIARYPYAHEYRLWPGPNSNTFVAHVARAVPALGLDLPATAIGKDYLAGGALFGRAPSGSGGQVSLGGVLGVLAARREGLELNLFGLVFGIDPLRGALKLPGLGRIGGG